MKLQRYFARKFLMMTGGIFLVFALFLTLLDMIEEMRRFDSANISFGDALGLAMLATPETLYSILPLVVLLATLALFLGLARTSELVVTRAAGRSAIRAMIAPALTAAVLGCLAVGVLDPIVAATKHLYQQRSAELSGDEYSVLSVSRDGLWLRQGGHAGQTVIRADRSNLDGTVLYGATFISFAPDNSDYDGPVRRVQAAKAQLRGKAWELSDVKIWPLRVENPEAASTRRDTYSLPSNLTEQQIRDSFAEPSSIPIWEIPAFINDLRQAGFSARLHRVWFQTQLALPLFLASMVMIGAGFTMRHTRFGRTGLMVMFALMMGFAAYFIRNFAQILGQNGDIPVALAAWAPPVAAMLMSLGLLLHLEDG